MSLVPWWGWVLLGLSFFWMLGAHNRVVALRTAIISAWSQVDGVLQARLQALAALRAAVEPRLAAEQAALDAVAAAHAQLAQAAEAMRPRPTDEDGPAALARAEAALAPALVRLSALIEQHADWRHEEAVARPQQVLQELAPRWQFARQMFNDAAAAYNAAIEQFPTRLLKRLFRFRRAGSF
ncbi:LemA family protein [Aquincola sp. S2]|uniref:LemA family protein n=1 Tax=Pseudaquabacterium terrae TaxID=2732868 RepID=A0ABX2EBD2_9BURK|nr:LemA family protein [Aquabacterium terrae]